MANDVIDMRLNRRGVYVHRRSNTALWIAGGLAATGALAAGAYILTKNARRDKKPAVEGPKGELPLVEAGGFTWANVRALPRPEDVEGFDLVRNWGKTPKRLRPLFASMELISGIEGSARIFALISKREADFVATAHNSDAKEVAGSQRAYSNAKGRNRPLKYGPESAEFGSGGLFAALAPYFLWTSVLELRGDAPLLNSRPEIVFLPRVAAFAACVYLKRLLNNHQIDDHADIKVGWANPSILRSGRGGNTYKAKRTRFFSDAVALGLDLGDLVTIPQHLSADRWPGARTVMNKLVGTLPIPVKG